MALLPATMQQAFDRLFRIERPRFAGLAAQRLAAIYADYAQAATAGVYGLVVLTGTERPRLESALRAALALPQGSALSLALAWTGGLSVFWAGAAFVGGGAATVVAGAPLLTGALAGLFSNPLNTESVSAAGLATALDVATRTLVVGGPSGPQPVV